MVMQIKLIVVVIVVVVVVVVTEVFSEKKHETMLQREQCPFLET